MVFEIFLNYYFIITLTILSAAALIALYNLFFADLLKIKEPKSYPKVSVMVPARNEQDNIANCLKNILTQNYPNFEVFVLNDNSEDLTLKIAKKTVAEYSNVTRAKHVEIIDGKPLENGWVGKSFGCHQMVQKASGELYLFIDADVTIEKETIKSAIALYQKTKANMLSVFPKQIMKTIGERLIVPLTDFMSLFFIPLDLVKRLKTPVFTLAIGQFILIDKETYHEIGGHEKIKSEVTEDMKLAREIKKAGRRLVAARSYGLIKCRMYTNIKDAIKGLGRFIYTGAQMKPFMFAFSFTIYLMIFILPFFVIPFYGKFLWIILPLAIIRVATSILAAQNLLINLFLFPIHLVLSAFIGFYSLHLYLSKKIVWKGRKVF